VPGARVRYLADIADTVRGYKRHAREQAALAREIQQLRESARMLHEDDATRDGAEGLHRQHVRAVAAHGVEDHRPQLADVPGERVGAEELRELAGDGGAALAEGRGRLVEEVVEEQREVAAAVAQRRDADLVRDEAVVEVLAERAGGLARGEVGVGRGDDARILEEETRVHIEIQFRNS